MKARYMEKYKYAYEIPSPNNNKLMDIFKTTCKSNGILYNIDECFDYLREFEDKNQHEQLIITGLDRKK